MRADNDRGPGAGSVSCREKVQLVVLLPVGPLGEKVRLENVRDTIESAYHFTTPGKKVLVLDDSRGDEAGRYLRTRFPDLVILKPPDTVLKGVGYSTSTHLYYMMCFGFEHILRNYDFELVLRLDTDALLIGPSPEADAVDFFRRNPEVGIIGSWKIDCNGAPRDYSWPRDRLRREVSLGSLLRRPGRWKGILFLRRMLNKAIRNGYEPGEHVLGVGNFYSRKCLETLQREGLLGKKDIHWSGLVDDHLFGLFLCAAGLKHGDFATGRLPVGVRWQGLPCSPEELLERGKKITHSTRFYGGMTEEDIREFFRRKRTGSLSSPETIPAPGR